MNQIPAIDIGMCYTHDCGHFNWDIVLYHKPFNSQIKTYDELFEMIWKKGNMNDPAKFFSITEYEATEIEYGEKYNIEKLRLSPYGHIKCSIFARKVAYLKSLKSQLPESQITKEYNIELEDYTPDMCHVDKQYFDEWYKTYRHKTSEIKMCLEYHEYLWNLPLSEFLRTNIDIDSLLHDSV